MPADIDQLLDRGAAEPTRPLDVDALRVRAGRARRRGRILTGAGAVGVLAIAVSVLAGGGDRVELRPGADTARPAPRFAVTATAEPDAALTDVLVEVSDPGEVAVGDTAEHQLTVTPVGRPVNLDGLAHLDQTVRHPNSGALQVLGICAQGYDTAPTCPDPAELIATADSPRRIPLRLRTDDLTAGTYELAVPLSTADDAAPAPPIHLTYTVTQVTAEADRQDPPPPADPQPDDIALVADPARVPPGATLNLSLHNNGRGVVGYGLEYTLQRWDGSTWTEVPAGGWEDLETPLQLEPGGASHPQVIQAPDTDGWYRVTRTVQAEDAGDEIVLHARFEVRAALLQELPGPEDAEVAGDEKVVDLPHRPVQNDHGVRMEALAEGTLRADPDTGCVWLELEQGGPLALVWYDELRVRFPEDGPAQVEDREGTVYAVEGQTVELGGGGVPEPAERCDLGRDLYFWAYF